METSVDEFADANPETHADAAARAMIDVAMGLYMSSTISAQHFCILCYWAWKAGIQQAAEFAQSPGKASRHYQRHLSRMLGLDFVREHSYPLI